MMDIIKPGFVIIVFVLLECFACFSQDSFLWPLPNNEGTVILKPGKTINPTTEEYIFNSGYIIGAKEDLPVLAVEDAKILGCIPYKITSPDLTFSTGFQSLNSFNDAKNIFSKRPWFKIENLMGSVALKLNDGSIVFYIGLKTGNCFFETGQNVKRGDTIGYVGNINVLTDKPCIGISVSKPDGSVGDIGLSLFGEESSLSSIKKANRKFDLLDTNSMKKALEILLLALNEGHPSLYDNISKEDFNLVVEKVENKLNRSIPIPEFRSLLMEIVAVIGCSHTYLKYIEPIKGDYTFPLWLSWVENRCIVVGAKTEKYAWLKGAEIVEINNTPIEQIISTMKNMMFNDVQTDEWKSLQLVKPNYFQFYMKYALKGIFEKEYTLVYRTGENVNRNYKMESLLIKEKRKNNLLPQLYVKQNEDFFCLMLDSNIAYVSLQSCTTTDIEKERFSFFIDSLNEFRVDNLIIDLRYNLGGSEVSYYVNKLAPKTTIDTIKYMVKSDSSYSFFKYSIDYMEGDMPFYDFKKDSDKKGFWKEDINCTIDSNLKPYSGQVYVITGSGEQSFGAEMAFQLYKRGAVIVGEETGGSYFHMNGIAFSKVKLANSNLILNLPLMKVLLNENNKTELGQNRGLVPHYKVNSTIESILENKDPFLESCMKIIKKNSFRDNIFIH